jgi:outer membrane immunogenic protein
MSKRAIFAAIAALAVTVTTATPSSAGPAPIWDGLYLGGHVGGGFGTFDQSCPTCLKISIDHDGVVAGIHAGYNFTAGSAILGVEGDMSWTDIEGSKNYRFTNGYAEVTTSANYLASIRGRIGLPVQNMLFYATAGVAWTEAEAAAKINVIGNGSVSFSGTEKFVGYVVGGGVEAKFTNNMSGRVEALYYGFDDEDKNNFGSTTDTTFDVTVVRAGLSYHFN